ncbi:5'/3'-nucleotidase SurE [Deferribacterales bacterium RsTz2092]|nr:5'-nucleotidase SurE [Deferribacterales bacterium]
MRILVSNDDGIQSHGLLSLVVALSKVAEVTLVAPAQEMSAVSRHLTLNNILIVDKFYKGGDFFGYAIHGTPADCVKLGLSELVKHKPDYVFSGINNGANVSSQICYSGTVAAALEGAADGITSVAVSLPTTERPSGLGYDASAEIALKWLEVMERGELPHGIVYNINVPPIPTAQMKGFVPATANETDFKMKYEKRNSPRGGTYYWLSDVQLPKSYADGSDVSCLKKGYIPVTPLNRLGVLDENAFRVLSTTTLN